MSHLMAFFPPHSDEDPINPAVESHPLQELCPVHTYPPAPQPATTSAMIHTYLPEPTPPGDFTMTLYRMRGEVVEEEEEEEEENQMREEEEDQHPTKVLLKEIDQSSELHDDPPCNFGPKVPHAGSTQHDLQHHSVCYPQIFLYEAQLSRATRNARPTSRASQLHTCIPAPSRLYSRLGNVRPYNNYRYSQELCLRLAVLLFLHCKLEMRSVIDQYHDKNGCLEHEKVQALASLEQHHLNEVTSIQNHFIGSRPGYENSTRPKGQLLREVPRREKARTKAMRRHTRCVCEREVRGVRAHKQKHTSSDKEEVLKRTYKGGPYTLQYTEIRGKHLVVNQRGHRMDGRTWAWRPRMRHTNAHAKHARHKANKMHSQIRQANTITPVSPPSWCHLIGKRPVITCTNIIGFLPIPDVRLEYLADKPISGNNGPLLTSILAVPIENATVGMLTEALMALQSQQTMFPSKSSREQDDEYMLYEGAAYKAISLFVGGMGPGPDPLALQWDMTTMHKKATTGPGDPRSRSDVISCKNFINAASAGEKPVLRSSVMALTRLCNKWEIAWWITRTINYGWLGSYLVGQQFQFLSIESILYVGQYFLFYWTPGVLSAVPASRFRCTFRVTCGDGTQFSSTFVD
ncbi:hypothetical protein EV424DRAFT_1345550 [Suillus variegatus]|nr:hypothetical protein EV424DRAFT_1345550 [Suillus variegatus]